SSALTRQWNTGCFGVHSKLAPRICSRWFDWIDVGFEVNDDVRLARQVREGGQLFVVVTRF
ncbi:hypothetical protein, partial [Roseibacillus persicicus]|uniref:hypothetical protein n=1 Tax=Roseibacillus persicicus TaxID=454148 RepID=UPI0028113980